MLEGLLSTGGPQVSGVPVSWYLALCGTLFAVGTLGVLIRRSAIILMMCIELMLGSVNVMLVVFSNLWNNVEGQILVFFSMAVAAAEVAVGLAIVLNVHRAHGTTDGTALRAEAEGQEFS